MIGFKLMVDKLLRCLRSEYVKFKNYEKKVKLPFVIYADFESILVTKENPDES